VPGVTVGAAPGVAATEVADPGVADVDCGESSGVRRGTRLPSGKE
jgi:hypothetical protein